MHMRPLGQTGFSISAMGYGCGGYWGYDFFNERTASQLVHMALDAGVNFLDTGASYSGGNAEIRLGRILKGVDTSHLLIGTKAGTVLYNGRLLKDYSSTSLRQQVEASLQRLGLERIPLLQLHGLPSQGLEEALAELSRLKLQGKVGLIGVSCDGKALDTALSLNVLDVVMLTYNILHKQAARQVKLAYARGCGILVKSPLAHTLYSDELFNIRKATDIWYLLRVLKNYPGQIWEGRKYRFINKLKGWSSHEVALLYALHENASCVVTGTTDIANMATNLQAFNRELPVELRAIIDAVK
ncbi:MAG: hypothetical protein C0391_07195 [Anaerolinea sp.]|nr:hypothetical protein [Anaerolinea sp.]